MAKLFVGTSGYSYSHWENGVFYPVGLPKNKELEYYAQHFDTVELNNPFYRLPSQETFENWERMVPENFIFAIKVSRFITHIKKLKDCQKPWQIFLERAVKLGKKLGPFLFQFPPRFQANEENSKRLEDFLKFIRENSRSNSRKFARYVFEFRHKSWCNERIYKLLKKYNVAWVIADSPSWPKAEVVTADFVYIRLHGSKVLFASKYTKKELSSLAKKIKKWLKQKLDVYVYFNNDAYGYATENAKTLTKFLNRVK